MIIIKAIQQPLPLSFVGEEITPSSCSSTMPSDFIVITGVWGMRVITSLRRSLIFERAPGAIDENDR
ncbi:hypothetical protein J2129_000178 [Methanofollis sp. W23]|nr:hypothetical protein [Methanofollis sp. W23]